MESGSKIPLSHSLWSPHDTVKDAAESLGINLTEESAKNLAMDVEYRIHEILETAIKFMRRSKRKLLTTGDINHSLKVLNIEPLYGYDNSQPLQFKEALVAAGGQTLYYIDDQEIELEKLINQELPKVPRQTTFTAHWLAIEGVQPIIPQNPSPAEIKSLPPAIRGATSSILGNDILNAAGNTEKNIMSTGSKNKKVTDKDTEVKPLVKHVLSKELKLYFDKVVDVLLSKDPEKEGLQNSALNSLKNDPGLHQLVPYFIQFVAEQITNQLRDIDILTTMLQVISALADNRSIFLDPYVHALMPCILTLLLAKNIGPNVKDFNDENGKSALKRNLAVREFAAILLKHIIVVYGSSYSTLKARVTRTLLRALLDSSKPIGTHYGALLGLKNMGNEVIKLVLIGNLKLWYNSVIDGINNDFAKEVLIDSVMDCLNELRIEDKLKTDDMQVDSEISEDLKSELAQRIGEPLAEEVLKLQNSKEIIRGIFFGELNV
ncbi:histone H4-like TAF Taf6, SAGA complex subunit [Yamadazyma tenuis]|uniref:TBP-associated factor 6 n=1 Tax=Candida tenuis (strain ATCC 10573 / BCRC 21748 / CBS 615 / JCM 9827 / NBRC 10315 / NRRL Y-1498 / VKM Y-70) TaxID=590646 RepID=G3AY92_CANTC|nr:DUF1546-domain-containing protein [Yamadazyma tenuis ATCC 10573]XP_006684759.1 uncharacterized protein CANTEDRAFT_112664 [Yamadazyma tenuis ATCC 10573]EGV66184.1 DUF1546-domain-containing protein [Yamadazyma tenuis ATCC 10573]EGV66185.1 hypothetical protein CANTEDRAFT_112664 [Yamadazyma tenuis ATCC 10573]WEJ95879.1 histone H4-like TAF Taf6, SAGA complex subunit [Yamadazyma tenuis]